MFNKPPSQSNRHPRILLIGQPNSGKSTLFNQVAGYRSISSNFAGATTEFTKSHFSIHDKTFDLFDLPGIYSLTSGDKASEESLARILDQDVDLIVNVVDASLLSRSLELTLQLLELGKPIILCLNMMDEAQRKGICIDHANLQKILAIPIVATIASKGQGIEELFDTIHQVVHHSFRPKFLELSKHVEDTITSLARIVQKHFKHHNGLSARTLAIKLLEGDRFFRRLLGAIPPDLGSQISDYQRLLERAHGQDAESVIASERHALAMNVFEKVAVVQHTKRSRRDRIDDFLMDPFWGYIAMIAILFTFFNVVFKFGAALESPVLQGTDWVIQRLTVLFPAESLIHHIMAGILQGIGGGLAIVFPYLIPFLMGIALLEDLGYLPRVAFLMDSLMHKIGLHGTAIIPTILGYGCSVPAIMATRVLPSSRDRFIATVVAALVPCSARMTLIMGLVGYYLGGTVALLVYLLNALVVAIIGTILSRLLPEDTPGMVLEMPSYKYPNFKVIVAKTWLRLKDFIIIAWPLLIVGSLILGLSDWFHLSTVINTIFQPITMVLGLPRELGITLIFGILRKELSLLMLFQALGTPQVTDVLTHDQIMIFTLFVVFYIPCLATLGIMGKEIGWKKTLFTILLTLSLALMISVAARALLAIF